MKKLLLLAVFLFPLLLFAQKVVLPVDSSTSLVTYQGIVYVEGASKDDLYVRAREWFAKTLILPRDIIRMDDKGAGKIIGKGSKLQSYKAIFNAIFYHLSYTISFTAKDGRYRYEITSFSIREQEDDHHEIIAGLPIENYYKQYMRGKDTILGTNRKIIPQVDVFAQNLIAGFVSALKSSNGLDSKDNF